MDPIILRQCQEAISSRTGTPPRIIGSTRPARTCLEWTLEWAGQDDRRYLVLDVDPAHPTVHLVRSTQPMERPGTGFAERILGARLAQIRLLDDARVWSFDLADSSGRLQWRLIAAWTGRSGNIRLVDPSGQVLEVLLPGGPRPGESYSPPPPDRRKPAAEAAGDLAAAIRDLPPERWHLAVRRLVQGAEITTALNAVLTALGRNPGLLNRSLDDVGARQAAESIQGALRLPQEDTSEISGSFHQYTFPRGDLLHDQDAGAGAKALAAHLGPRADSALRLEALGLPAAELTSVSLDALGRYRSSEDRPLADLLARTYTLQRQRVEEDHQRACALRIMRQEAARLRRLHQHLLEERGDPEAGARLRRSGEAILAYLHMAKKGDRFLSCPDWSDPSGEAEMRIALDPAKNPADNAQEYFRLARRWERGEPHRKKRLAAIDAASARLAELEARVEESPKPPRMTRLITEIERALGFLISPRVRDILQCAEGGGGADSGAHGVDRRGRDAGGERGGRGGPSGGGRQSQGGPSGGDRPGRGDPNRAAAARAEQEARFRPRSFQTKEGWTVLVGRSNEENDYLTHRMAHAEDYWMHAHGVPGSHVVLRREGRKDNPSARTLEEAASIAAFFSKARHSGKVPVLYTLKKYVRKPRKAKPGLAVCTREKTILVAPKDPMEGKAPEWMDED